MLLLLDTSGCSYLQGMHGIPVTIILFHSNKVEWDALLRNIVQRQ